MKVWANLDIRLPLSEVADAARRAERIGFDCISAPDVMYDGLLVASTAIAATQTIQVATSALVCFPRSPMTVAVAAWNLQEYSNGRFRLGLGPLIAQNIIQKYSTNWYPPARRMREYIHSLRAIFRRWQYGEELNYSGEYYKFTRQQDFTAPSPIAHPDIPIHLAAIGPNMCALAGELADGVFAHPTNSSPKYFRNNMIPSLERGAARTGRSLGAIEKIACPFVAIGRNEKQIAAQWQKAKRTLATVYSTPNYWPSLELMGLDDIGPRLKQMVKEGKWSEMNDLFTEDMAEFFIYRGSFENISKILKSDYQNLIDGIALQLPENPDDDELMAGVIAELKHC